MKKIFISLFVLSISFSCTDLDLVPQNGLVEGVAFQDFDGYESYVAKIYASLTLTGQQGPAGNADLSIINDEGFSSYLRVWWKAQELTTDEAIIAWNDSGIRDLHNHTWGADNQFVRVLYYRVYYTIALANDFLRVSETLPTNLTAGEAERIEEYINEVRFIRAFAYWHALDMFRNVTLLTTITPDLPSQVAPSDVFNFIESELNDLENSSSTLPANSNQDASLYGRANLAAIWMLKARLYLNAEVYIGESKYTECLTEVNKVIGSGVFTIHNATGSGYTPYKELFMGDNHLHTDEIIWPIVHDGLVSQTWGGTTTIIRGGIGGAMMDGTGEAEDTYGVPSGWGGYRATPEFVGLFPGASTNNGVSADGRGFFFTEGQSLAVTAIGEFTSGWPTPKFNNIESTTGERAAPSNGDHVSTDFPVFRLADAYLMYAESILRGGSGGDLGTAVGYINELRERAYGDTSGNIVQGDLDLDFILDERGRELYLEATRRSDLIRYNRFSGGDYIWEWKGGNQQAGESTPSHLDIFPIPSSDLIANPNLIQNPNY